MKAAWQPFIVVRHGDLDHGMAALRAAQRDCRDIQVDAHCRLFDVVAAEYFVIDKGIDEYSDRLKHVVFPFVKRCLAVRERQAKFIAAAMNTRVMYWERKLTAIPQSSIFTSTGTSRETPAQIIDRLRLEKGWTVEQLAARAGVGETQIYRIKKGKPVSSDTISSVAEALGCHPGDLFPGGHSLKRQR
jgi:DNA-binding Xre family transcriptional regulator